MSVSEEDRKLFRNAVQGTRRLLQKQTFQPKRPPAIQKTRIKRSRLDHDESLHTNPLSDPYSVSEIETGEKLSFSRPHIPQRTIRKLRRGQLYQASVLDLHGKTVNQARHIIERFLDHHIPPENSCVRVIHGKGLGSNKGPVLKKMLYHWLPQHSRVLAFCSAQPADGGTGAIYLLLKRK